MRGLLRLKLVHLTRVHHPNQFGQLHLQPVLPRVAVLPHVGVLRQVLLHRLQALGQQLLVPLVHLVHLRVHGGLLLDHRPVVHLGQVLGAHAARQPLLAPGPGLRPGAGGWRALRGEVVDAVLHALPEERHVHFQSVRPLELPGEVVVLGPGVLLLVRQQHRGRLVDALQDHLLPLQLRHGRRHRLLELQPGFKERRGPMH
mmetsp:Transcript_76729/g.128959  ORF Transcript_76729/g.128959 Transcript_76729/m.128959 type:complete len:201 (+) Transcript_76729:493-1095(+)